MSLEVVWPRHKWDYLNVADADMPANPPPLPSTSSTCADSADASPHRSMSTAAAVALPDDAQGLSATFEIDDSNIEFTLPDDAQGLSATFEIDDSNIEFGSRRRRAHRAGRRERSHAPADPTHQQGRALAVHAFLQGARCRVGRVSAVLGVRHQTVSRDRARPPVTAPSVLEVAQACIAATADRGSTPKERAAAEAWLTAGATPAPVDRGPSIGAAAETAAPVTFEMGKSNITGAGETAPPIEVSMVLGRQTASMPAPMTRDQVDACCRLHRRIRVRTDAIRRLLEPDPARDEMMEVVLDLLVEIQGAAAELETLLQDGRSGPAPAA